MSNRKSVLAAICAIGRATCNDIDELSGLGVTKTRFTIGDIKKAGLVISVKDAITGQPAYELSPSGIQWLKDNKSDADEQAAKATTTEKPMSETEELAFLRIEVKKLREANTGLAVESDERNKRIEALDAELHRKNSMADDYLKKLGHAQQQIDSLNEQLMHGDEAVDVKDAARGYLVCAPKRKPAKFMKPESAVAKAKAAAKATGRSEVFALVPVGIAIEKRVKSVEWKDATA